MGLTTNATASSSSTMATSIDDFLASSDPWRIAYPGLPLPLPYRIASIGDSSLCTHLDRNMEGIPKILNNLDIPARNFSAAQCWRTDHRTTRIIISVQVEGEEIAMWRKAAKMIYTIFEAGCLPDVQVQISNPARYQCHLISRDPPPPEAAAIFDSVTDKLFRVVSGLGDRCEGFGLYMSGNLDDLNPTVVIFVKEQAEFDWITFVRTCKSVIGSSYLAVRIQPGLLRLGEAENGYSSTWAQELHREPRNGSWTRMEEWLQSLLAYVLILVDKQLLSSRISRPFSLISRQRWDAKSGFHAQAIWVCSINSPI